MLEAATQAPVSNQAEQLPGTAAKPAATQRLVIEEPYSRTGCSRGLFQGIAPAQWQEQNLWQDLEKGQTPAEVEKILGPEHYDESGGGNVIWHYGRCGVSSRAQVLFTQGRLTDWRAPVP
jgi:predicted nucleic acid-binding Zn ribbon protein